MYRYTRELVVTKTQFHTDIVEKSQEDPRKKGLKNTDKRRLSAG